MARAIAWAARTSTTASLNGVFCSLILQAHAPCPAPSTSAELRRTVSWRDRTAIAPYHHGAQTALHRGLRAGIPMMENATRRPAYARSGRTRTTAAASDHRHHPTLTRRRPTPVRLADALAPAATPPPPPPAQSHHSMAYVITFGLIIFCLRMLAWLACKKATGQAVGQVTQGQSRTRPSTRVQPALAPPGNRNENTPAILMRSRSGNRAAILVPTRRQREPGLLSAPIVNPVGVQPADYIPPELMLSDGPAGAAVVPSESAIQATTLSSIRNTVLESTCPLVIFCSGTHAFVLCIVSR